MKKIVTVGGGTGSYTVLSGLKNLKNVCLYAIVSMADNGGSTRILRDELGVLPPGDVRQCLVALSEHTETVRKLMNYRFSDNGTLKGHSFGNILLAALEKVTGDFSKGVEVASEILKVRGKVVPVTRNQAELCALLPGGRRVCGHIEIGRTNLRKLGLKKIFYKQKVVLNDKARSALLKADYVLIGPGDYYESIVPNLIVSGFREAVGKSGARFILPVNLTNKKTHTKGWKASDYVRDIEEYLGRKVDIILINSESPSRAQVKRYKLKEGDGVLIEDDLGLDPRAVRKPLLSHLFFDHIRSFIRHDSEKVAKCVAEIIKKDSRKKK